MTTPVPLAEALASWTAPGPASVSVGQAVKALGGGDAGFIVYLWAAPGPEINNGYEYLASPGDCVLNCIWREPGTVRYRDGWAGL
jgi:hypothetical protein